MTFYEPVLLESGVTQDLEFERWANLVNDEKNEKRSSLRKERRDITIVEMDENGTPVLAFNLLKCWISEYQTFQDENDGSGAVAIEALRIENEGWERIKAYKGPRRSTKSRYSVYLSPIDQDKKSE